MKDKEKTIEYLRSVHAGLAGDALPPSFAKLYSQYTRLKMNQPSLMGWRNEEFSERLADAVALIDLGLSERELGVEEWRSALKRAGELLEWLSHPDLNVEKLPLRLLSAGVYQLAGYPALSMGLLKSEQSDSSDSQILIALLKGDFPKLDSLIINYWGSEMTEMKKRKGIFRQINPSDINSLLVDEIVKVLGVLCMYMRWGDENRLEKARQKLNSLSNVMIYGTDNYSWLLSKIVSEVVEENISSSMRKYVVKLQNEVSDYGKTAFERYLRSNYKARKSLAWYSQIHGIERLLEDGSFALCTPTGSGKTTIAELAIIQSIFNKDIEDTFLSVGPIVMYLVPSRALASEVESKLGTVLGNLGNHSVKVTGLYGGIDWGPTDAWVTSEEPTVLICTYEKGEALIRFLGPLFLNRVSLVIIDEAHSVQFNKKNYEELRSADDRSLRLEMLANRLLRYVGEKRIIALSAVADESASLAQWVSGSEEATPVISSYRSTRQLIGRLEWAHSGKYEIRYDTLNGNNLTFSENDGDDNVPYIQKPFTGFPVPYQSIPKMFTNEKNGVSKRQRPSLFWAAMQLAQPDEQGIQHSVLISVTQHVGGYAEDFLYVLNKTFSEIQLPEFFKLPNDSYRQQLFEKCLNSCADYFGENSNEYQLLTKGIVVHHGNMPGLLSRLLVELIQKQVVYIIVATSTLSEGVNLPFETIIIPTLLRGQEPLSISEFKNLIGRAGRPGWGTEGRTLVFLESKPEDYSSEMAHENYFRLIDELTNEQLPQEDSGVASPLGALVSHIAGAWAEVSKSRSISELMEWLERTVPLENFVTDNMLTAEEALDSLDGYLLSIIVEQEMLTGHQINNSQLEDYFINVWRKTYASYVMSQNDLWERIFSTRGRAIQENIYPEPEQRRRIYRTSVSPRFAKEILNNYLLINEHLKTGIDYSEWPVERRQQFIIHTVELISELEKFTIPDSFGSGKTPTTWKEILKWWLNPTESSKKPTKKQVSRWIKIIKQHFEYKFNWGLGTVLALILDDVNEGYLRKTSIEDWPRTGLPWIAFWLKELMSWGTLDPVAALLLANGIEHTRVAAENKAKDYYVTYKELSVEEKLNPIKIKEWANQFQKKRVSKDEGIILKNLKVNLSRDFSDVNSLEWRVVPINFRKYISWIDPAGYELATSEVPDNWTEDMPSIYDFVLDIQTELVRISKFL